MYIWVERLPHSLHCICKPFKPFEVIVFCSFVWENPSILIVMVCCFTCHYNCITGWRSRLLDDACVKVAKKAVSCCGHHDLLFCPGIQTSSHSPSPDKLFYIHQASGCNLGNLATETLDGEQVIMNQ